MHHAKMIMFLVLWCCLLFDRVYCKSACDEVDILFVIDDKSIFENGEYIIDFITHIAAHDSSEYAGFSVNVYGNNLPTGLPAILLELVDTEPIHQRTSLITHIGDTLQPYFDEISDAFDDSAASVTSVALLDAFETISSQTQPVREHHKYKLCGDDPYCKIGIHDDSQRIFVFDYDNKLSVDNNKMLSQQWQQQYSNNQSIGAYQLVDSNVEICELFHYLENDETRGEGLMILEGKKLDNSDFALVCEFSNGINKIPQLLRDQPHTFIEFSDDITSNIELMEKIGSVTCPANINTQNGNFNLGNHVQWLSANTISECNTKYVENTNNANVNTVPRLTPDSYILVKDFADDDMTFKKNDYLISDPDTFDSTPKNCSIPVYKIIRMETERGQQIATYKRKRRLRGKNKKGKRARKKEKKGKRARKKKKKDKRARKKKEKKKNYRILKLYVQIPRSPNEYIYDIDIQGDDVELLFPEDGDIVDTNDTSIGNIDRRRRLFFDLEDSGETDLVYFHLGNDFEYVYENSVGYNSESTGSNPSKGGSKGSSSPSISVQGNGKITIAYGYGFEIDVKLYYDFSWSLLGSDIHYEVKLHGFYRVYAYFTVTIEADLVVNIDNLLNYEKHMFFWVGPVPVLITPFINMGVELKMEPFKITTGIDCEYKESFEVGHYYDYKEVCDYEYYHTGCWVACVLGCGTDYCVGRISNDCWWSNKWKCRSCNSIEVEESRPINEATVERNSCEKILDISTGEDDDTEDSCPVAEFGFTVTATLKIGASLYQIHIVYLKAELGIPFRINMPELDGTMCGQSSSFDMCTLDTLKASFTYALTLDFSVGYEFALGQILDEIYELIIGGDDDSGFSFSGVEVSLFTIDIIPETSLGCMNLNGILSPIESHYRGLCCATPAPTACLSETDYVIKRNTNNSTYSELLKNINIGDYIYDGDVFTKVLTVERGPKQQMIEFVLSNIHSVHKNTSVTMTLNHLLYDKNGQLITANDIKIGDMIFNDYIVNNINKDAQYSLTPYTFSGYLQVNNITVSNYVHDKKLAQLSHEFLWIFRWFSENVNEQITGKVLQQISYQRYYLKFKKIFGQKMMENKVFFNIIAVISLPFIIGENLFSLVSFEQMIFIGILVCCIFLVPIIVLRKKM